MQIIKGISVFFGWLFTGFLLLCAINLKSPYLFNFRDYLTFGIIIFCLIVGIYLIRIIRKKSRHQGSKIGLLIMVAAIFTVTMVNECRYQWYRSVVLRADTVLLKKLGAHFIVGYEALDKLESLVSKGAVSGVFITRKNIEGKSYSQIKTEIKDLQILNATTYEVTLLIATDQEGGMVSKFSPPFPLLPTLGKITQGQSVELATLEARQQGKTHGTQLLAIGVNVNLSPVVDLKNNREKNPLDFHSFINNRAISDQPQRVAEIALAYSIGLNESGVIPTVKHFPGMGRVVNDTHHFASSVETNRMDLEKTDWIPFQFILKNTNAFMMLGHVILANIDNLPVSYSKKVIQTIIRQDWQYKGVLITDDLSMNPFNGSDEGICQASILALNGGVDLLLISYDHEKYYDVMYCLLNAYEKNELDLVMLEKSRARVIKARQNAFSSL